MHREKCEREMLRTGPPAQGGETSERKPGSPWVLSLGESVHQVRKEEKGVPSRTKPWRHFDALGGGHWRCESCKWFPRVRLCDRGDSGH